MIIWIYGQSKSGKTTFAKELQQKTGAILLDGDKMRATINKDLDLSQEGRWENNLRIARLAKELENQGFDVIIATILPYKDLRFEVWKITDCKFIELKGGIKHKDYPYEK